MRPTNNGWKHGTKRGRIASPSGISEPHDCDRGGKCQGRAEKNDNRPDTVSADEKKLLGQVSGWQGDGYNDWPGAQDGRGFAEWIAYLLQEHLLGWVITIFAVSAHHSGSIPSGKFMNLRKRVNLRSQVRVDTSFAVGSAATGGKRSLSAKNLWCGRHLCLVRREGVGQRDDLQASLQLVQGSSARDWKIDRLAGQQIKVVVGGLGVDVAEADVDVASQYSG